MRNYLLIMAKRAEFRAGAWSLSDIALYAGDVAFDSGLVGEDELTMTGLVFTLVTDEPFNPDDWA